MIDNGYLFANDNKRLFINTSLGCDSKCKFCYLDKIGYQDRSEVKTSDEIIKMINAADYKINSDTLITFGCFSECFDDKNKVEVIKLIKYFLSSGNQVQVSTKRYVSYEDVKELLSLIKYYGQFVIFVSTSTITSHGEYEYMTEGVERRFKTFDLIKYIPVILYMKPVLQNVTIKDVESYKALIDSKKIENVVVGTLFTEDIGEETVHFSNENKLFYNECEDEAKIIDCLSSCTKVWRRSTEVLRYLKVGYK